MKKLLLCAVLAFVAVSCQDDENTPENQPANITFTQVSKSELYGNGAENISQGNVVVNTTAQWQELLDKMTAVNDLPEDFTDTDIDFGQYTVIASFDEVKPNGGFAVNVTSVVNTGESVTVTVAYFSGGDGTGATVMNQPYHIVKIPKTTLPIIFE